MNSVTSYCFENYLCSGVANFCQRQACTKCGPVAARISSVDMRPAEKLFTKCDPFTVLSFVCLFEAKKLAVLKCVKLFRPLVPIVK